MDMSILKKYLPEELIEFASKFDIPEEFLEIDAELIILILQSKALETEEEKQNWFNLLPLMTEEQIYKFKDILIKERTKLNEIEQKYAEKRKELRQKQLLRWQKMWYIDKVKKIQEQEEAMKNKEEEEAEELLNNL